MSLKAYTLAVAVGIVGFIAGAYVDSKKYEIGDAIVDLTVGGRTPLTITLRNDTAQPIVVARYDAVSSDLRTIAPGDRLPLHESDEWLAGYRSDRRNDRYGLSLVLQVQSADGAKRWLIALPYNAMLGITHVTLCVARFADQPITKLTRGMIDASCVTNR